VHRVAARKRQPDGERRERAERERDAPAKRQGEHRQRQSADEDRRRDTGLLDAEAEPLAVGRDLLGDEQVDRRLRDRVGHARHREQEEQQRERRRERRGGERPRRDEDAAPHRAQRADVVGEPAAPPGRQCAREKEDGHARRDGLHAGVEVLVDLQRERADEEARQDAGRAGRYR
jgi:hypothetical protein